MMEGKAIRPSAKLGKNEPMGIRGLKQDGGDEGDRNGLGQDGDTEESEEDVRNPFKWWGEETDNEKEEDMEKREVGDTPSKSKDKGEEAEKGAEEEEDREDAEVLRKEQARKPKFRKSPKKPTKAEREEHEVLHLPYKAWCRHCVRGRGRNRPHRKDEDEEAPDANQVSRVSMDYFFMNKNDKAASDNPMILMLEEETGNVYMRATGMKGLGEGTHMEWLIKDMHEELKSWGHPGGEGHKIIFKSDGEPAIVAVRETLGRYHGGTVIPEQPPRGESQSNGRVEEAGKTIRGMVRVYVSQLEERANVEIEPEDVILQWAIRWAAMAYARYKVGEDGKTAYERQKGRKCKLEVISFGEKVMFKMLKITDGKQEKMNTDWREGLWLGHSRISSEVYIGTEEGVVRAWAVKRKAEGEKWDAELVKK